MIYDYSRVTDHLKIVLELYDMEIHQKTSIPIEFENNGEEKYRSETSIEKFWCQKRDNRDRCSGCESQCYQWRAKGQCSRGNQCSFRHESNDRAKPTPKAAPSSELPTPRGIHKSCAASSKHPKKAKGYRWILYKSKVLMSAVLAPWKLRTDLRNGPKEKSDASAESRGNLPRRSFSLKEGFLPVASTKAGGQGVSGGLWSKHACSHDFESPELETVRISKNPIMVVAANGEVLPNEEATVYVRELDLFVKVMFLDNTPKVLPLGKICEDHGYNYHWTQWSQTTCHQKWKKIDCNTANCVPFIVPGLSLIFTSPHSWQETVTPTEHPVTTRSESMSEEVRGGIAEWWVQGVPDWLQEFKHGLVDASVPEHRYTSSFFSWITLGSANKSGTE